jgi:hypothetical protein
MLPAHWLEALDAPKLFGAGRVSMPPWLVGCFRRSTITFNEVWLRRRARAPPNTIKPVSSAWLGGCPAPAPVSDCWVRTQETYNGNTFPLFDDSTDVVWLQAGNRCGDMRIAASRPPMVARRALGDCSDAELVALAAQDAWYGCCRTEVSEQIHAIQSTVADWHDSVTSGGLATASKFPEKGLMMRVGDAVMEFAPSGAYVEDWRASPTASDTTVRARAGRLSGLSISLYKSVFYGAFVWVRMALNSQKRRSSTRAVQRRAGPPRGGRAPGSRRPRGDRPDGAAADLIPHHETFSTAIQPPYSSTKG